MQQRAYVMQVLQKGPREGRGSCRDN